MRKQKLKNKNERGQNEIFPENGTNTSAAVPRTEETRENNEKMVVSLKSQKSNEGRVSE